MNDQPLVTIVTPSYNHDRFIAATIESVLNQDYPNIEYIIMDGGSTDKTAEVVGPYSDQLTFISEPDRGQSHAINKGFAMARGEIVAWLNSDDLFLPGAVSKAVAAFQTHRDAGVVYGEGYQIDIDGSITSRFPHTQPFDLWRLTHMSDYILQQTVFFRKAALETVGEIREDLHYVMDWDILIRLGKEFDFVYVPEFMGSLREYEAAKTFSGGTKRAKEIREMLQSHTGKVFPEGYIVYGLDAYSHFWAQKIQGFPLGDEFKQRATGLMYRICRRIIGRVASHSQGVYADGWMSKTAHYMLRRGAGDICVSGSMPDIPSLRGQVLTISAGSRVCARLDVHPGDFDLTFLAPHEAAQKAVAFHIACSRSFVPAHLEASTDARALSVILNRFEWAEQAGSSAKIKPASDPTIV